MNYILINISKTISRQNLRNQWSWDANCVSKKINLFLLKNFVCVFDSFDVLISKIIFKKIKKYHFDVFWHEKYFKKQSQSYFQANRMKQDIVPRNLPSN